MSKDEETLAFFTTVPCPCPYLKDRIESKLAVDISGPGAQLWSDVLSRAGFRRSHTICYLPACPDCKSCVSVRIRTAGFAPSKKQRKVLRLNADKQVSFLPNIADTEQYALFRAYLNARHADGEMSAMSFDEYRAMIEDGPVQSRLLEIRENGALKGVMLIDDLDDGLSAVYSFFDPSEADKSLGTFMILRLVEEAARNGRPYVYLGYWIPQVSNMAYKKRFRPLEYFVDGKWTESVPDQM